MVILRTKNGTEQDGTERERNENGTIEKKERKQNDLVEGPF